MLSGFENWRAIKSPLKTVSDIKHVHVHPLIVLAQTRIGHVVKTVANLKASGDVPRQSDMGGKLEWNPQVMPPKGVTAQPSGTDTAFNSHGKSSTRQ